MHQGIDHDRFGKRDPKHCGTIALAGIVKGRTCGSGVDGSLPARRAAASAVRGSGF